MDKVRSLVVVLALLSFSGVAAAQTRITADTILELIQTEKPKSVDELLGLLPAELQANYSLVYESRNTAQFASTEKPRILLFSKDGGFQMAVTGDVGVAGGDSIEMSSQQMDGTFKYSSATLNAKGFVHNSSPVTCMKCHGTTPRPIWDSYPVWPGVLGSDHDRLRDARFGSRALDFKFKKSSLEVASLENLQKSASGTRYERLAGFADAAYGDLANKNMYFSDTLVRARNREIISHLLNSPEFPKFRGRLLANLNIVDREYNIINSNHFKGFTGENPESLYGEFETLQKTRDAEVSKYLEQLSSRMKALDSTYSPGPFRTPFLAFDQDAFTEVELISKRMGIASSLWSHGIQGVPRYAGGGVISFVQFRSELIEELVARNPSLKRYVASSVMGGTEKILGLSDKGLKVLSDPNYTTPNRPLKFSAVVDRYPQRSATSRPGSGVCLAILQRIGAAIGSIFK